MNNIVNIMDNEVTLTMEEILSIRCPKCSAAPTGKCLENKRQGIGGMQYIENPHVERVKAALISKLGIKKVA